MTILLPDLIKQHALGRPDADALCFKTQTLSYADLWQQITAFQQGMLAADLKRHDRVAIYLPKQIETVTAMFGTSAAGGVFVPVNPGLKARQVSYIMQNCNVRILITSADRLKVMQEFLHECDDLRRIVIVGKMPEDIDTHGVDVESWDDFVISEPDHQRAAHPVIDADMTAILYTSGSTGMPKGVVLSYRNMVAGAQSVATYLNNCPEDVILSVLPLSFDAGLSQLTTAFYAGAKVVLMNYLLPRDVIRAVAKNKVTGLTLVPPLWVQLAELEWQEEAVSSLRYIATTGGRMPIPVTEKLSSVLSHSDIYLMYGLTEAFRSTYLPPEEVKRRPDSIGRAIPNAEILVVREDGTLCGPGEPGELVHRGALVSLGYWNDMERTKERFRPAPGQVSGLPNPELAVWSGDTVKMDDEGYLYFVGRRDEMIKTSGFRVSPTELEEIIYASGLVGEVAAIGVEDMQLGQAIYIVVTAKDGHDFEEETLIAFCRQEMPTYMVPKRVILWDALPRNPNGKVDRKKIAADITITNDA